MYRLYEAKVETKGFEAKNPNRIKTTKEFTGEIVCYAKKESSVYIAADGRVYPCCNTGYHYNTDKSRNKQIIDLQTLVGAPNIQSTPLSTLIEHKFLYEIQQRWSTTPLEKCKYTCGVHRDNLHAVTVL